MQAILNLYKLMFFEPFWFLLHLITDLWSHRKTLQELQTTLWQYNFCIEQNHWSHFNILQQQPPLQGGTKKLYQILTDFHNYFTVRIMGCSLALWRCT